MTEYPFESHNRDQIRDVAKKAGVVNVSYKTKAENIEAMKQLGVVGIEVREGEGLFPIIVKDGGVLANNDPDYIDDVLDIEQHDPDRQGTWAEEALKEAIGEAQDPSRPYHLAIHADGRSTVTFVSNGDLVSVTSDHAAYLRVLEALLSGQDPEPWLDEAAQVESIVEHLGDRLSLVFPAAPSEDESKPVVLFDGKPIHGRMVDVFLRYHLEGRDASNLVKFLEKCAANPVPGAAQLLFDWQGSERMTITPEGDFVGWKSFYRNHDGSFRPTTSGPGYVNGEPVNDDWKINVGDVVTIDPDLVSPGPECSVGLHVGSFEYSMPFFGDVKCHVQVDPSKVVNVPKHENGKMRVVEYKVLEVISEVAEASPHDASRYEPPGVESRFDVVMEEAQVPEGFWKRLLKRRRTKVGV